MTRPWEIFAPMSRNAFGYPGGPSAKARELSALLVGDHENVFVRSLYLHALLFICWFIWVVGCIVVVSVFAKPLVLGPLGRVSGGSFESYLSEWLLSINVLPRLCHTAFPLCSTFYLPGCVCVSLFVFLFVFVAALHQCHSAFPLCSNLPSCLLCLCFSLQHLCFLDL